MPKPALLRKPYQYELPIAKAKIFLAELKALDKSYGTKLQCSLVATKPITLGIRLDVFFLGYCPGFCGPTSSTGLTKLEWDEFTAKLYVITELALGTTVDVQYEPWSDKKKFQVNLNLYIKYEELP